MRSRQRAACSLVGPLRGRRARARTTRLRLGVPPPQRRPPEVASLRTASPGAHRAPARAYGDPIQLPMARPSAFDLVLMTTTSRRQLHAGGAARSSGASPRVRTTTGSGRALLDRCRRLRDVVDHRRWRRRGKRRDHARLHREQPARPGDGRSDCGHEGEGGQGPSEVRRARDGDPGGAYARDGVCPEHRQIVRDRAASRSTRHGSARWVRSARELGHVPSRRRDPHLLDRLLDSRPQLLRRGEAVLAAEREAARQDARDGRVGVRRRRERGRAHEEGAQALAAPAYRRRGRARHEVEERRADAPDVGPAVDLIGARLLRRHEREPSRGSRRTPSPEPRVAASWPRRSRSVWRSPRPRRARCEERRPGGRRRRALRSRR